MKPEVRNTAHVGDVVIFPLYDAQGEPRPHHVDVPGLRFLGVRRIPLHDLWRDMHFIGFGAPEHRPARIFDAKSNRGEAFLAQLSGGGTVQVLLTLPRLAEHCVSCRTVHYFLTVLP